VLAIDVAANPTVAKELAQQGPAGLATAVLKQPSAAVHEQRLILPGRAAETPAGEPLGEHLTVAEVTPTKVMIRWDDRGMRETGQAVQALVSLLASWQPAPNSTTAAAQAQSLPEPRTDPANREEALLKLTIAMLNHRQGELSAKLAGQRLSAPSAEEAGILPKQKELSRELKQVESQKEIVEKRLAELRKGNAPPDIAKTQVAAREKPSAPIDPESTRTPAADVFTVVEGPTSPVAMRSAVWQIEGYWVLGGLLAAFSYAGAALWWFRPVGGVAGLQGILPDKLLLVGTIVEIHR
jgi:hypothetical protein